VSAAVVAAGLLAYANTFQNGFVWDDVSSILVNQHIQDPSQIGQLFREDFHAFGRGQGNFYRPLLAVTFLLDFALSNPGERGDAQTLMNLLSPFLFHVSNLFWHLAAALCLFALASRLRAPRYVQAALPTLYALHPLHTEAVAYISGRADPMAAAWMFAGLWCGVAAVEKTGRRGALALGGVCTFFVFALFTKESATIFPALLALVIGLRPHEADAQPIPVFRKLRPIALAIPILLVYVLLRMTLLHFADASGEAAPLGTRLTQTLQALALYVKLAILPTGLHMERSLDNAPGWLAIVGGALLAALALWTIHAWRTQRTRAALGLLWFLAGWLPVSGLFPLNAPMAEHWMYVPIAGLLWAILEYVSPLLQTPRARVAAWTVTYVYALLLLGLTVDRNREWRDNETLYLATLRENPDSIRVRYNLAVTYDSLLDNMPAARRQYEEVIRRYAAKKGPLSGSKNEMFWDDELDAHLSLGNIYLEMRQIEKAVPHFEIVLRIQPTEKQKGLLGKAALGLGQCYWAAGKPDMATPLFQKAIQYRPDLKPHIERLLGAMR